jgi:DNA polymerase bacteriophage-type
VASFVSLDFETRSCCDLKKAGAHAYFEDRSTEVLCAAFAFDNDENIEIWYPGQPLSRRLKAHVETGGVIRAWNASFERLAWREIMVKRHGWPPMKDDQWQCTMTESLCMNMPGKLKDAAPAFGLTTAKDDEGHRLMMKMCKPRKARKGEDKALIYWHEGEELTQRLGEYCKQDVRTERAIGQRAMRMHPRERQLYLLDMKINDRGVYIDKDLCEAASIIVESATERLNGEMKRVTQGGVGACSNTAELKRWLNLRGVETDSVDKEHVEDLLILEIPDDCRRALELRQEGSKTSTAKLISMLRRRQRDGRMRGNLQFYGASATGRWAARGAQLQNLTRPMILTLKKISLDYQIQKAIECVFAGSSMIVEIIYGQPLTLIADLVRSMVCAAKGRILRSSDFSNIEGRIVAWAAGQEDKLDVFRAYDAGTGPDVYLIQAAGMYNCTVKEAEPHRQIGKVGELSLGFQGGPRAFAKMAKNYGVRIAQLFDGIWQNAADVFKESAESNWDDRGRKTGMSREGWLASEVIKLAWRAKNWRIEKFWKEVEDAAIDAVRHKGQEFPAGKVTFKMSGSFLFCLLPSGRSLCYPYPRLKDTETPWGATRQSLVFKSIDQFTKKWKDKAFYGGLGVENITQAIARDVMAEAMLRVEKAGYHTVLTVHDEIITEDAVDFGSLKEFMALMAESPVWASGLPITVSGWEGTRYRKG